jgi:hypothetical protein
VKHTMDSGNSQAKKARRDDPRGDKGTYRKVTVTLPPDAYECLVRECAYSSAASKSSLEGYSRISHGRLARRKHSPG